MSPLLSRFPWPSQHMSIRASVISDHYVASAHNTFTELWLPLLDTQTCTCTRPCNTRSQKMFVEFNIYFLTSFCPIKINLFFLQIHFYTYFKNVSHVSLRVSPNCTMSNWVFFFQIFQLKLAHETIFYTDLFQKKKVKQSKLHNFILFCPL